MKVIGTNIIKLNLPFCSNKKNLQKDSSFVQKNNMDSTFICYKDFNISFTGKSSQKKDKLEAQKKQQIYKELRKQGCGEKISYSILNNQKKYNRMLELKDNSKKANIIQNLSLKDVVICVDNDFSDEQIKRYIQLKNFLYSKKDDSLAIKDIDVLVKNNFDDIQVNRYIELRKNNKDGKVITSRQPTRSEASIIVKENMNNIQAETYLRLTDTHLGIDIKDFVLDEEKSKRFVKMTTVDERGKTYFSKKIDDAFSFIVVNNYLTDEQIQRLINLQEGKNSLVNKKLDFSEAFVIASNDIPDEQITRFLEIKNLFIKKDNTQLNREKDDYFKTIYTNRNINRRTLIALQNNFDNNKVEIFSNLDSDFSEKTILDLFTDDEKYSRFSYLKSQINEQEAPLNDYEAFVSVNNGLSDKQAFVFRDIIRSFDRFSQRSALMFVRDIEKLEQFYSYTRTDDEGNTLFSRNLTPKEAHNVMLEDLDAESIENLIEIIDKNPELDVSCAIKIVDFSDFKNKKNINELFIDEKKLLLKKIVQQNASLFSSKIKQDDYPLVPKNKEAYCEILPKIANSIGIDTKSLSEDEKKICLNGIDGLIKHIKYADLEGINPKLVYSQKDFVEQASVFLNLLDKSEQLIVMDFFGFEIKNGKLKGYPISNKSEEDINAIKNNRIKRVILSVKPFVEKFSENNSVIISQNKLLEADLNKIFEGLPELRTMIGKTQHATHSYTLDMHTLHVLQNIVKNPRFNNLSYSDKQVLTLVALLHDITKTEGMIDKTHPRESSFDAYYIIQKLELDESQQIKIFELINTHDWLEKLNKSYGEKREVLAQDYAFEMRHSNTFELAKILCTADLKSVTENGSFFSIYSQALISLGDKVSFYIKELQKSQIFLPQTRIPSASKIKNATEKTLDGVTNTVIYMDKEKDLSIYGFEKGTTINNWSGLVHGLDNEEKLQTFATFSIIDSDALLSTSLMNAKDYKVFRQQGLILDVNSNDIHVGYYKDFGSGFHKNIETLKSKYLFSKQKNEYRTYISNLIKQNMNISDEEYCEYMKKMEACKSITDVEKVDKKFAEEIEKLLISMEKGRRNHGRKYNEILVSRPKIQGIFSYGQSFEKIPFFIRKYAQENDLAILMFGNN